MKKTKLGTHTLEVFDSISELSVERFHQFNKLALIDSGVGSDLASADVHLGRIGAYINQGQRENAIQEIKNLRQNIALVISGVSPKLMSFAALVNSVDGKQYGCTDGDLEELCEVLKDVPQMEFAKTFSDLKKK